jgi:hypothetical protein
MVAENNDVNQTRKACHMYIEQILAQVYAERRSEMSAPDAQLALREKIFRDNALCRQIHRLAVCEFDWDIWVVDFEEELGRPPSSHFESQAEASDRLEG